MSKHPRRGFQTAHSRSSSRLCLSDLSDPSRSRTLLNVMSSHPSDSSLNGTPSRFAKYQPQPPTSPRSRDNDPFLSISRAISNVKVRAGARLTALAVKQRYVRSTAQQRYVHMTAKVVTRILLCATLIAVTAFILFQQRSVLDAKSAAGRGLGLFSKGDRHKRGDLSLNALLRHRPPHVTTKHFETGPWVIVTVTDLDKESCYFQESRQAPMHRSSCGKANTWVSYYKRGIFRLQQNSVKFAHDELATASISWLDELQLSSHGQLEVMNESRTSFGGRGMELSELEWFTGHLLTPDDHTGMLLEIMSPRGLLDARTQHEFYGQPSNIPPSTFHRALLLDGSGNDSSALFKSEWMVVKDDQLIVGGHGRSFTEPGDGTKVKSDNPKWIKTVSKDFTVKHIDWSKRYNALAKAAGVPFPGYLMHEAVLWSVERREWIFLPRRRSEQPFDPVKNERKGYNIAIIASENFKKIRTISIDGLADSSGLRGFSTAKFVPGTADRVIIAVRTVESESNSAPDHRRETASFLSVFEIPSGKIILNEQQFSMKKYEGLVFL